MLHAKNFHSELKETFSYLLTGYVGSLRMSNPAAFGRRTPRMLHQTGHQTLQYGLKKNIISDNTGCYEIYGGYTRVDFLINPSNRL